MWDFKIYVLLNKDLNDVKRKSYLKPNWTSVMLAKYFRYIYFNILKMLGYFSFNWSKHLLTFSSAISKLWLSLDWWIKQTLQMHSFQLGNIVLLFRITFLTLFRIFRGFFLYQAGSAITQSYYVQTIFWTQRYHRWNGISHRMWYCYFLHKTYSKKTT